jgi:hypothetical protein
MNVRPLCDFVAEDELTWCADRPAGRAMHATLSSNGSFRCPSISRIASRRIFQQRYRGMGVLACAHAADTCCTIFEKGDHHPAAAG